MGLGASSPTRVIPKDAAIFRQSGQGRFVTVRGPDRGETFVLGSSILTVGSGSGSDVRLTDPTVSRRHLTISPAQGGALVRDLGSTNGSFVGGARFQELLLGFGSEIQIGQTCLKYLPDEEPVEVEPAAREEFGGAVGRDPKMRQVFSLLADVAPSDATVLLEGETGTGKEVLAEAIHRTSARKDKPFVVFDCGAVPKELIESALYGHVRGAFTGAVADRQGAFVEADGGTLFFDEIGELSMEMQPTLLRALDKRVVKPVGGSAYRNVSVRVLAATNRDLRSEMAARRFREDLYYRLAVVRIAVPPLRERPEDVPLLIEHFIRTFARTPGLRVSASDVQRLARLPWPGNVRQLRNLVERACALAHGEELDLSDFLGSVDAPGPGMKSIDFDRPFKQAKAEVVDEFERVYLKGLLDKHAGNLSAAARGAELDRKHLRELLRKHGLREDSE